MLTKKKYKMIGTPVHQVHRVSIFIILKLPSQIKVWSGEHPPFFNRLFLNELNQEKDFESHKQILPKLFPTKIFKSYKNYMDFRNYKNLLISRVIVNSWRSLTVEHYHTNTEHWICWNYKNFISKWTLLDISNWISFQVSSHLTKW